MMLREVIRKLIRSLLEDLSDRQLALSQQKQGEVVAEPPDDLGAVQSGELPFYRGGGGPLQRGHAYFISSEMMAKFYGPVTEYRIKSWSLDDSKGQVKRSSLLPPDKP